MSAETKHEEEVHVLKMQIAINEMLPAQLRCDDFIARMKVKLARLEKKSQNLKLVIDNDA
jgi:hypothetical protein